MLRLFKRRKIWYIRGTVAKVSVYESTGFSDKRDAEDRRANRESEIIQGASLGRRSTITFAQAALIYMESGGEARFLGPILLHFGESFRLADVDQEAVNRCAQALYPTASPATINRQVITPISAVVNMDDSLCAPRRFRRRKGVGRRTRWLTPQEAERLIKASDPRTSDKIHFLLGTGCRVSEALTLDAAHLHLESQEAWIASTKNGTPRMVRFPLRTKRWLAARGMPSKGAVFLTPKGLPYKVTGQHGGQFATAFNAARDAAGLGPDVTPHVLRHTFATWFHAQTGDFGKLLDLGGWKKSDMANVYRKIAPASLSDDLLEYGWDYRPPIPQGGKSARSA